MKIRIHRFLPLTEAEGPGKRACLWVQGCSVRCEGCGVPWTWSDKGGKDISVDDLFEKIVDSKKENNIEGVTFLGGEPMDQAEALAELADKIKTAGLSILTFSGRYLEDIKSNPRKGQLELLELTDLFIDGPFEKENIDLSRPWTGSSNQRYHFLTERYRYLEGQLQSISNKIEVRLEPDGTVSINGMIRQEQMQNLYEELSKHKVSNRN
ncbi:4Fe-4S single cluster domain-containing protein [Bacillus haynesii]|uniref:4Fe-4S single cluster domain-containing protein n=1 Tax=Bacillus haynesii TaxID=1925021 RepID=UPI001592B3C3|nr:4Fe-4S single cluster domain-containing protein [Bacillus haynesii]NVB35041.1 radical SAM protein [Bacillus licheniformis]MCY7776994.1 radical SAM protein [Bacillus haynesii]MEC0672559.1 4Fe-4S single cluster domain-containing protein [Bacillus haynesii]MEC1417733.1 4Fe-4S single cluster domain-containing protein [Bacillus haynesii]MEC1470102.1 4Fe-4S single cluster domain-containing protein [Bacillus haynesii]